ncbi:lamin tail domain-containing protein [Nocardioides sp. GCM10027113]|uniref:lamin tail domain-containing protein n=1 Tax=unclassified Nocardioides TaxID=2615069 RepID=UPI0036173C80
MTRLSPLAAALAVASGTALVAVPGTTAQAASTDVVISEVYGGGGNSGAPYKNDFVELRNLGSTTVSLAGWSVQYASATGSSWTNRTALSGSVAPGATYLVQLAGGSTGAALPTPQATGTTNMSATSGKVALVTNNTNLTCGSNCDTHASVKDFVGYGSANDSETATAPSGSNTTSLTRAGADTDHNGNDFAAGAPTPGSASGGGGGSCTGTRIHDVQKASHTGQTGSVNGLAGIVVATSTTGFWMQDTDACADADPATSEGILVYTSTAPTVVVGDAVEVGGSVTEYRSGGASSDNLTTTQVTGPTVTKTATGQPLPSATVVGSGGRVPPATVIDDDATGNVETSGTFDATTDGIDFWESMEGMRVTVNAPQVVGATNSYGETAVVPNGSGVRTPRGGILVSATDFNPERVLLDDVLSAAPQAKVGDTLGASVTGVLDYSFSNFKLLPTATPAVVAGTLTPEVTTAAPAGTLATATFNVENLDPSDPQSKFDGLAQQIVTNLRSPDLIALEEVQDNSGATNNGVVSASTTYSKLISAISAAGGPAYDYRQIDPADGADGGEPGGNIRVAFLFRTDRGLAFVDRGTATATTATTVTGSGASTTLSHSPGRVDPQNAAWSSTRKPLVGEFTWNGKKFFAIANHFSSKGGDDPLFGKVQPPVNSSEPKRHDQAGVVRGFVDQLLAADPNARVVVLGDINDFEFSRTTDILVGSGATALTSLPRTLPANERYSYVYQGNSQVLDQILASASLAGSAAYDIVHVNAEFQNPLSDHDPSVARFTF